MHKLSLTISNVSLQLSNQEPSFFSERRDVIERRTIDTRFPSAPESGSKGSTGSNSIKARAAARAGSRRRSVDENASKQLKGEKNIFHPNLKQCQLFN